MFEHHDDILNIDQFCELLDICKNTGYTLLRNGVIKGFKIGKKWKIPVKAVEDYVMRNIRRTEQQ